MLLKKALMLCFAFSFGFCSCVETQEYRGSSFQKLDNGVSAVFIDAASRANSLLVLLCVSAGSTDEFEKRGVANLLTKVFSKKLKENANENSLQYGSESDSYVGYDQSVYYYYGKTENLEGFLKNFGSIFSSFTVSDESLEKCKKNVEQSIIDNAQLDRKLIQCESRKSLYFHSQYGYPIEGDMDDLRRITSEDIENFKNKHYTNNRATIVIVGNVNKTSAMDMVRKYFGKGEQVSKIERLQEPPRHGSTTKIRKISPQVSVPIIEMYWRITNYRTDKDRALALEIFVNALDKILRKRLMDELGIAASISFCYSFWNYEYGDFCITLTPKNSDRVDMLETAVLAEIKCIVDDGITRQQAEEAAKNLSEASDFTKKDLIDVVDFFSKRISSGNDFDFIKGHAAFVKKFDLDRINSCGKETFRHDPCVISVIVPSDTAAGDSR